MFVSGVLFRMKTRYIFSMGTLSRSGNTLVFKNAKEKITIPIHNTREIYMFNEVTVNTKLLDFISKANITLHFFNYGGYYTGSFIPKDYLRSGKLVVKQVELFLNHREFVAKKFVWGMSENLYDLIYHYYRNDKKEVKEYLDWIRGDFRRMLEKAETVNQIMAIEGQLWNGFYDQFKYFLPEDFVMNKRVRRPPDNPINALIGFGNSLLYSKCMTQIYHTQLNQEVSYLHDPSVSRFSLSLDVAEVFKPSLVFKTIFELVNRKKLRVVDHFDASLNYARLNEDGKKIFVKAFEERLRKTFKHDRLKRNVSFEHAIKLECYKLIKMMTEGVVYEPFHEKGKR